MSQPTITGLSLSLSVSAVCVAITVMLRSANFLSESAVTPGQSTPTNWLMPAAAYCAASDGCCMLTPIVKCDGSPETSTRNFSGNGAA